MRISLRALDGFVLQRALMAANPLPLLLNRYGLRVPSAVSGGLPLSMFTQQVTPFQAVIWSMSIASAAKQILWLFTIAKEAMTPGEALLICFFNTSLNGFNTLSFSLAAINPTWSTQSFYLSIPIFATGMLIEYVSEYQRKTFKDDPDNNGKVYSNGLFGYARHINYCGYMIWRTAMGLAAGGWAGAALISGLFWYDFNNRSIPVLDEYCSAKYGNRWQDFRRKVPFAFFPGLK